MACVSQECRIAACPTKRLSKHSLLRQRRTGYRPSALIRILDQPNGPAERSVETFNSGKKSQDRSKSTRGGGKKGPAARPPTDRRHRRPKGEREAIRDRPSTRLGTAVKPATLHGQSVAGNRRDRRGFQRARHSYLVTSASRNPRLSRLRLSSSPRRSPAPLRPHGLCDRGAERHHGNSPWTSCDSPLSTLQVAFRAFVPEARRDAVFCGMNGRLQTTVSKLSTCASCLLQR